MNGVADGALVVASGVLLELVVVGLTVVDDGLAVVVDQADQPEVTPEAVG